MAVATKPGDHLRATFSHGGVAFAADRPHGSYLYDSRGSTVRHYVSSSEGERYLGFGEPSGPLDKAGRRLRVAATDAMAYDALSTDPLYKHWPCGVVVTPGDPAAATPPIAYGVLYDNLAQGSLDFGREISAFRGRYRYYEAEAGDVDVYLALGPTALEATQQLAWLMGRSHPPPRWALGYMGSTMVYTEADDAQARLKRFGELCCEHGIPCGAFHLSSGYTADADGRRCVFTWNTSRVPDPPAMFGDFKSRGMAVLPNIKPWLLTCHPGYAALAAAGGLLKTVDGTAPLVGRFWSGGPGSSADGSYVDFASAAGYEWWVNELTSSLVAHGAGGAWNDNNEFEVDDDGARCGGPPPSASAPAAIGVVGRALHPLLMARASRDALLAARPDERPFVISRSGCVGTQRYAQQTWSGDNRTGWETLRANIPMGLSLGLSGWPSCGHDVGAFAGPRPDAELFVRWVQQGALQPRFTIHSGFKSDGSCNEPWMYPEALPHVRAAILLRYRLLPLLHSLHLEAHLRGTPVARPLCLHFPADAAAAAADHLYTLGPSLLVATVLDAGAAEWTTHLPAGDGVVGGVWCDVESGAWHPAGAATTRIVNLGSVPMYAAGGAVVPVDLALPATVDTCYALTAIDIPPASPPPATAAPPAGPRALMIFVPPVYIGSFEATVYDDDGESNAYATGGYCVLKVRVTAGAPSVKVTGRGVDATLHRGGSRAAAWRYAQLRRWRHRADDP